MSRPLQIERQVDYRPCKDCGAQAAYYGSVDEARIAPEARCPSGRHHVWRRFWALPAPSRKKTA